MSAIKGYGITSDTQLDELAKQMGFKLSYIGFAEDLDHIPLGASIINLGSDQLGGTHWTLLYSTGDTIYGSSKGARERSAIYYFDSYGAPPEDQIIRLADRTPIFINRKQLQGFTEEYCGIWVLLMAKELVDEKKDKLEAFKRFVDRYNQVR